MKVYAVIDNRSGDNKVYSLHFVEHVAQKKADELQKEYEEIMNKESLDSVAWVREMKVSN